MGSAHFSVQTAVELQQITNGALLLKAKTLRERAVKSSLNMYYSESIKIESDQNLLKFTFNTCKRNKALKSSVFQNKPKCPNSFEVII